MPPLLRRALLGRRLSSSSARWKRIGGPRRRRTAARPWRPARLAIACAVDVFIRARCTGPQERAASTSASKTSKPSDRVFASEIRCS